MKLTFDHQGVIRTLAKHPSVVRQLKSGELTEAQAEFRPWYLRVIIGTKQQTFKLRAKDKDAISDAKTILNSRVHAPETFGAFVAVREARRGCTIDDLAAQWTAAGLPFTTAKPRKPAAVKTLTGTLKRALSWWADKRWSAINPNIIEEFAVWRRKHVRAGSFSGNRSADLELTCLSSLGQWALASNRVEANPFAHRTRFVEAEDIHHCHTAMPDDDQQFHALLIPFFADPTDKGKVVSGAYLAFMALTGLRPGEPISLLRVPPCDKFPANFETAPCGLVYPLPDGTRRMKVFRLKRGQNPAVLVHPALAEFLGHYNNWLAKYFPADPATIGPLPLFPDLPKKTHIHLAKACKRAKVHPMKPHGFGRAYYVRVRRSMGIDDATIACELGQSTNGALIRSVYGNPRDPVGGMLHDWLPAQDGTALDTAWQQLTAPAQSNIIAI